MSKDKLELKYLVSGTVQIDRPENWDNMKLEERELYVSAGMSKFSDKDLVDGLKDTALDNKKYIWDVQPEVCAVIDPLNVNIEYCMMSVTWHCYAFSACRPGRIVTSANRLVDAEDIR